MSHLACVRMKTVFLGPSFLLWDGNKPGWTDVRFFLSPNLLFFFQTCPPSLHYKGTRSHLAKTKYMNKEKKKNSNAMPLSRDHELSTRDNLQLLLWAVLGRDYFLSTVQNHTCQLCHHAKGSKHLHLYGRYLQNSRFINSTTDLITRIMLLANDISAKPQVNSQLIFYLFWPSRSWMEIVWFPVKYSWFGSLQKKDGEVCRSIQKEKPSYPQTFSLVSLKLWSAGLLLLFTVIKQRQNLDISVFCRNC